jgi:queuine tRNA-ribosyltransferase
MRGTHALGARLLAIHNVTHYQVLMRKMRAAIQQGTFDALYQELFPLLKRTEKGQG